MSVAQDLESSEPGLDWTYATRVRPREPWSGLVRRGETLRITDTFGSQAVDTLFYAAENRGERYCSQATVRTQGNVYIREGTVLVSNEDRPMLTVVTDTLNDHDTAAGCCSKESNAVRYGAETGHQHACRENFLSELSRYEMGKRDIVSNLNFFMRVPVNADGSFAIVDGLSVAGTFIDLRAEMDVICVLSNCPQMNNPCNAYSPTAIDVAIAAAQQSRA